jgi:hypothetical protein
MFVVSPLPAGGSREGLDGVFLPSETVWFWVGSGPVPGGYISVCRSVASSYVQTTGSSSFTSGLSWNVGFSGRFGL